MDLATANRTTTDAFTINEKPAKLSRPFPRKTRNALPIIAQNEATEIMIKPNNP
jgi:hypothetical protein